MFDKILLFCKKGYYTRKHLDGLLTAGVICEREYLRLLQILDVGN